MAKKHVVVLGGGFAGVAVVEKLLSYNTFEITLIDKNRYHLFTPSLYEVATSEEPKKNIAILYSELFGNKITLRQETAERIDVKNRIVKTTKENIGYDFLVIALGSESAYHNIPGLKEHSVALKSLNDALVIKEKIKTMCCHEGECNRKVHVIIGGGGFSGTELAAELLSYKSRLAKQHHLAADCLDITIVQGSPRLLPELDKHVSAIAQKRLRSSQMHFAFGGHIAKVTKDKVVTDNNMSYPYDICIWTGGVKANSIAEESHLPVNKQGQVVVNEFLQVSDTILAAGDIAGYINPKTQQPIPNVAQVAQDQGKTAAENIFHLTQNTSLTPYRFRHYGYIVPLRGKYAAAELMGFFHVDGFLGWVLQQFIFLRYLLEILPLQKALHKWNTFEADLSNRS